MSPTIFPFDLPIRQGQLLFRSYVAKHIDELKEKYGTYCFISHERPNELCWSWGDVEVEVLSDTEVRFTTYDAGMGFGGAVSKSRDTIDHSYTDNTLNKFIQAHKMEIVAHEYKVREAAKADAARKAAIAAVYAELFGDLV